MGLGGLGKVGEMGGIAEVGKLCVSNWTRENTFTMGSLYTS